MPALSAPVAVDPDFQRCRALSQRLVRQPARHRVARRSLAAAAAAPAVRLDDTARQNRTIRLESLPDDFEPKLVEAAKRGQVRATSQRRCSETFPRERPRPVPSVPALPHKASGRLISWLGWTAAVQEWWRPEETPLVRLSADTRRVGEQPGVH